MYKLTLKHDDGFSFSVEYGVYTEAIVGLTAAINAAQIDNCFGSAKLERIVEDEEI